MIPVSLTNTMTGKKQVVTPLQEGIVTMYVCGITPYDFAHVGHGRCYVTFDLLYRLLEFFGYKVIYCRNFTDIDDKLLHRAEREFQDSSQYHEVATRFITAYGQDMERLACRRPTYEPRVTDHIPHIIELIQGLIDTGHAYVVDGDVYYHVRSFAKYGYLSGRNIDDLKVGARVAVDAHKRDPLDFALWKSEAAGTFWESPWGSGRPGWHIECSALAATYLGRTIDIHGGGMDLIFPHHENEIAQSEGRFNVEFARSWVHNAFVRIHKEKMSKSLGNFFTLRDLFEKYDPMVIRYYFLQHQYRNPLDFSWDDVDVAQKSYQRICKAINPEALLATTLSPVVYGVMRAALSDADRAIFDAMVAFLADDLNTPGMWGKVFESLPQIAQSDSLAHAVRLLLQQVLGLALQPLPEKVVEITPEIQQLIDARAAARQAKDFQKADALRDQLQALGVDVQDRKL